MVECIFIGSPNVLASFWFLMFGKVGPTKLAMECADWFGIRTFPESQW